MCIILTIHAINGIVILLIALLFILAEGEYVIPRCTVFGLEKEELQALLGKGFK